MATQQPAERELEVVSIPTDDKATIEIVPLGSDERIKLSVSIIQKMIAVPTRTGKIPDANQCIKFMMLCRARHLNPFEGDAYLLGYDTQSGPQFSLITAHQVFLKRAEASKGFNGMESGVIVRTADHDGKIGGGPILEREGDLVYDDEKLLGGWAKVYRKDREIPFYRRLKLATFNTNRSRWEKDPAGMICKCAEADALRTAFPSHLGGLYIEEEPQVIDAQSSALTIKRASVPKLNDKLPVDAQPEPDAPEATPSLSGKTEGEAPESAPSPQTDSKIDSGGGQTSKNKSVTKLRKKNVTPPEPQVGPNESQMIMRLAGLGKTKEQLVHVARGFEALPENEGWDQIKEEGFAGLLDSDNWALVEAELKTL